MEAETEEEKESGLFSECWQEIALPVFTMVVMRNHWQFVVRPDTHQQVSAFFRRLTVTPTMRWHAYYHGGGTGHLYQGRFKSFPVPSDEHRLAVMRYVERNPVRVLLAERAELSRWVESTCRPRGRPRIESCPLYCLLGVFFA